MLTAQEGAQPSNGVSKTTVVKTIENGQKVAIFRNVGYMPWIHPQEMPCKKSLIKYI